MKQKDIEVGGVYLAKVSGNVVSVRVDAVRESWDGKTRYDVTNLATRRRITFRSALRFRMKWHE